MPITLTITVTMMVTVIPHALTRLPSRLLEELLLVVLLDLGVLVAPHEDTAHEAPVDGAGVEDDGVLLVVAGVGGDGHDAVDPSGKLGEPGRMGVKAWSLNTFSIHTSSLARSKGV